MSKKKQEVSDNLDIIKKRLSIRFLSYEAPVEFCVHNAGSKDHERCYLRYSEDKFVEWSREKAMEVTKDLMRWNIRNEKKLIFRSTENFKLYDQKYSALLSSLRESIEELFSSDSELYNKVKAACFAE